MVPSHLPGKQTSVMPSNLPHAREAALVQQSVPDEPTAVMQTDGQLRRGASKGGRRAAAAQHRDESPEAAMQRQALIARMQQVRGCATPAPAIFAPQNLDEMTTGARAVVVVSVITVNEAAPQLWDLVRRPTQP